MNKKCIENERGKVFYWIRKRSKDKCIFLCHGLTADHSLFEKQFEYFEKDYTLIAWDMPLHGKSICYKDFSLISAAEDIKMILENEDIKHTVLAGQSAGGYAAQKFIDSFPKMCDAFIGIDTSPLEKQYYSSFDFFLTKHYSFLAGLMPYKIYAKEAAKQATYTEEGYRSFYKTLVKLGKKNMKKAASSVYRELPKYKDVKINCPVLLIVGENDNVGKVKKYNEMWNKNKGYKLVTIKNAGHNSNFDNYKDFNKIVYEFLKENKI